VSGRRPLADPATVAVVHSEVPDGMTLAEYRRVVDERAGRRRRRRRRRWLSLT
jgi:hypothetical protein